MWESPPSQMPTHAPFPSWSPYAGAFVGGAVAAGGAQLSPAAADSSRLPSEHVHVPDHAWNQSAHGAGAHGGSGYRENFLSLFGASNVVPEVFQDIPAACDYVRFAPCYNHEVWSSHGFIISSSDCSGLSLHRHGNGIREANGVFFFLRGELAGAGSFGDYRPAAEFMSTNSNRHELDIRPQGMGSSSSGSGAASVATRRRTEERVGGNAKKSKQEASRKASPPKAQAPKVKLGEKITALQQIVSPFGKTDTSSVLFETIKYIKFLHEQLRVSACAQHAMCLSFFF
ncbi:transcription factor bHLH111-like [Panicum virgatum]|uniref:transcription factor bHLH111-like n=1 Tax=Panicum virgatum TaxID=38727 RepID=UPI0019D528E4|nr:transcription factor bHLH111-like [Panicum virgatum]